MTLGHFLHFLPAGLFPFGGCTATKLKKKLANSIWLANQLHSYKMHNVCTVNQLDIVLKLRYIDADRKKILYQTLYLQGLTWSCTWSSIVVGEATTVCVYAMT